ncbi:hypothetical protein Hanom_Chr00s000002g01600271 [Helianthus anomalus]
MLDDIQRRDNLLDAAKAKESRLLVEKQKAEEDLKREKERVITHALKVQGELERKVVLEAEKVRALPSQVAQLYIDHEFVSQVQEHHHSLMAKMEDTQAKLDQANQRCDELVVQQSQLQCDLDVEKSRRAKSQNATNHALAEAQELSA